MTDRTDTAARPLARGVGLSLVAALVLLAACSSDDESATTTASLTSPPPAPVTPAPTAVTIAATTVVAPAAPATTAATIAVPDGAVLLQQAFDAIAPGYSFLITATVNGTVAVTIAGDQIGATSRQTVTSQGKAVDYVLLPEGTWFAENGEWNELDEPAPVTDPLAALRTPSSVVVTASTADLTTLVATYPAATLNLAGDQPIAVTVELTGATLRSFSYTTPDGTATSRTEILPLTNAAPITSPSA